MPDLGTALSERETMKLTDLESIVEHGLQTFVVVGAALSQIRDQRLYRTTHDTFEAYCQERWGWSRQRASQLIAASDVVASLSTIVDTPPQNEGQARALARVPEDRRVEVWETAVENAPLVNGKPRVTARQVAAAASITARDQPRHSRTDGRLERLKAIYLDAPKHVQRSFEKWVASR